MTWIDVVTLLAALGAGLIAGAFFAFSSFIMGALAKPFAPILRSLPAGDKLTAMLALVPTPLPRPLPENPSQPVGVRRGRVVLPAGCAQSVLDPGINEAAIRLLTRAGVEVVLAKDEACCGALVHHMGRSEASHAAARNNVDAWMREIEGEGLDAIIVTTSGCGTTIKDYGFMLRLEPAYAEKAAKVSALAKDISEFLETLELGSPTHRSSLTVAYHAACSLQHGQQIRTAPKTLLMRAGFKVRATGDTGVHLHEVSGDMLIDVVKAPAGDVRLRAAASIFDGNGTDATDVFGRSITLTTDFGSVGESSKALEIDSSFAMRRDATTRHVGCASGCSPAHDFRDMITAPLADPARSCSTRLRSSSTTGRRR